MSFIFGIVSILLSVSHVLIAGIMVHFGIWPGNLIASLITALAITGIVLGGLALRDGINVCAVLGLTFNIVAVAFQVWSFYVTNVFFLDSKHSLIIVWIRGEMYEMQRVLI